MKISVAYGDGIGPEIMEATLQILKEAKAGLELEPVEMGEAVFLKGNSSGITASAWDSIRSTKVLLKGPLTTPQGGGMKSVNVTLRKSLGLFANVRPCVSYHPVIETKHPSMNLVIIRENEEDLYGGIEHQQTDEVVQCLKLISRPGSERIIRYAFEYAVRNGRKKVSCLTKDNIMKLTDGLFHSIFDQIGEEYPSIEKEHIIIDIGTARIADTPEDFDVVVTGNLYGDIISDVAAQITGSVGLAGSANIGQHCAMFEAIHGSAPQIAGKGIANPSGLLLAAVSMLVHIGKADIAEKVHGALLKTIEDGIHTGDIASEGKTTRVASTKEFTEAVIERLGSSPATLTHPEYKKSDTPMQLETFVKQHKPAVKTLVGIDVFVHRKCQPEQLAEVLNASSTEKLSLTMITNRGVKVWPDPLPETFCTDHWRCRFEFKGEKSGNNADLIELLTALNSKQVDCVKTENLYLFDGKPGYSLGQGQ